MKKDWDTSRKRFEAWWHGSAIDRVLLQVMAPLAQPPAGVPPAPEAPSLEQQWLDAGWRLKAFEHEAALTFYGGDAFPYIETHIGPGTLSLYLGSIPELQPSTVWYAPCISDITTAEVPGYDERNRYWQFSQAFASEAMERVEGRALVSIPDLIEGLDTLSSLVGNEELLLYLVDEPQHVHRFQKPLVDRYFDYYDRLYDIVKDEAGGCCFSAFNTYAPGRMAKLQCDFSAMISPAMYEEFVIPYLTRQCSRLDYSVFHLDGPCCLQHLDLLLGISDLNAIQWTPGAGQPAPTWEGYLPLYRRIRSAGKAVMVRGGSAAEARRLVEELGPGGLDILLWVQTQAEAEAIVRDSSNWRKTA